MNQTQLLVYDKTHGFSRFIKLYFSNEFEVQIWKGDGNDMLTKDIQYVAFIQINSYDDLKEGMVLAHHSKFIFWSSSIKEIKKSFMNVDNFVYLDMEHTKKTLLAIIKSSIELM